ncbi:multidrug transporter [Plantibacter flavus]|uniref:multidrug transporter n=1 Tax=Plantibacter flavus TaxID=150123 RepID=UPI003F18DB11
MSTREHDSADDGRHDQLTTAPKSTEADAAPRIDVTDQGDGVKRIDIRDDAAVRPGTDPDD